MAYLTIHRLNGDPDELLRRKQTKFGPVTSRLAPDYGAIFSVTAKTEDGLLIVNLWDSPQGPVQFAQVPEVLGAQQASGLPAPSRFERYPGRCLRRLRPSSSRPRGALLRNVL